MSRRRIRLLLGLALITALLVSSGAFETAYASRTARPTLQSSQTLKINRVGSYDTPGNARHVQVIGSLAYVADDAGGLQIVDVSNPANPALRGSYSRAGVVHDVTVVDNKAYILHPSGLQILDVSNPASPKLVGSYPLLGSALEVVGNRAYVLSSVELLIIDVSNPSNPTLRGTFRNGSGFVSFQVVGNFAYICFEKDPVGGLQIIDVSDPSSPTARGSWASYYIGVEHISVVDGFAYLALFERFLGTTLQVVRVNDPDRPISFGGRARTGNSTNIYSEAAWSVEGVTAQLAYLGTMTYYPGAVGHVTLFDWSNWDNPSRRASYDALTAVYDLQAVGARLYVADGPAGLQILELDLPFKTFLPLVAQ